MRKHAPSKLTLARETLHRLAGSAMREALGGSQATAPSDATACVCVTELCVSANYTGCTTCNS